MEIKKKYLDLRGENIMKKVFLLFIGLLFTSIFVSCSNEPEIPSTLEFYDVCYTEMDYNSGAYRYPSESDKVTDIETNKEYIIFIKLHSPDLNFKKLVFTNGGYTGEINFTDDDTDYEWYYCEGVYWGAGTVGPMNVTYWLVDDLGRKSNSIKLTLNMMEPAAE